VEEAEESASSPQSTDFVVAFLYGGARDEDGFNEAHRAGEAAVGRMMNVKVIHEDNVPEGSAALNYLEKVVTLRGASMVFATGANQFDPPVLEAAKKHPKLPFFHAGGLYQEGKHPANVGSYLGYLDEAFYVCGGGGGDDHQSNKLGFIAGLGNAASLRNVDAFTLGARSVNPRVTTRGAVHQQLVGREGGGEGRERAGGQEGRRAGQLRALAAGHPDDGGEAGDLQHRGAQRRGGVGAQGASDGGGVELGEDLHGLRDGGARRKGVLTRGARRLRDGFVNIAPFGPAVSEQTKAKALEVRSKLMQGKLTSSRARSRTTGAPPVLRAGQEVVAKDVSLEMMGYLVEGVVGSIPD
jgi:simple sugar transport system substrate-binding protein